MIVFGNLQAVYEFGLAFLFVYLCLLHSGTLPPPIGYVHFAIVDMVLPVVICVYSVHVPTVRDTDLCATPLPRR